MNKLFLALSVAFVMAGCSQKPEDAATRIAVDVPYEPFEYKTANGDLTGFEIDLGNAACEQAGIKCEWVVQAWDGIVPGLLASKYDVIFSSMSITPERAAKVQFTKPYYNTPSAWFAVKDSALNPEKPAELAGKKIGVQRGTIQDTYATENFADSEIVRYGTADELVLDLFGGRLDTVLLDFPVGEKTILENKEKGAGFSQLGNSMQLGEGIGAAMRPADKELVDKFNKALDTLKTNGKYDEIRKKYFDYDIKV